MIYLLQSGNAKPLDVLTRSLQKEGPMFLFKGWTPAFIRLGPNTILLFVFFEVRHNDRPYNVVQTMQLTCLWLQQLKKGWTTITESS